MPITLRDVAARAGVSRSAVSRTFTPGASVSPATRARVEQAAADLGFSPNALARSLTTGQTRMIGLVSDNFRNPVFLQIFDLFTRGLQDRGLRPLLVNLSGAMDMDSSLQLLRQYSVDGVIVASSTLPPAFARTFRDAGVPVVNAFGRPAPLPEVDTVGIDNLACGALACDVLAARGYRRVHVLCGPEHATTTQDRLAGFLRQAAHYPGLTVSQSCAAAYAYAAGRDGMQRLLAAGPPAEAYFCGDDVLSLGAIGALRDAGLAVPGDVGILGVNDMEMAGWDSIALTTIRQPLDRIVAATLDAMDARLADPLRPATSLLLSGTLVERSTLRRVP